MVPLQVESAGRTGAVAFEVEPPGGAADALGEVVDGGRGTGRDPPAGQGGAGLGRGGLAEQEAHHAAVAGAEREPPAGGQVEALRVAAELAEHRGEAGAAEPFLEHPERLLRPPGPDDDEAARVEAELVEAGAIGLAALPRRRLLEDEEDRPVVETGEAGEQRRGEAARGGDIARLRGPDLVERVPPEAAAERPVEVGDAEGKHRPAPARREELPRRGRVGGSAGERSCPFGKGGIPGGRSVWPALDLGNAAGELGKPLPRHENACAHGLRTCWLRICS